MCRTTSYARSGYARYRELRRDWTVAQIRNAHLRAENQRLAREVEALRTDPRVLEQVARTDMGGCGQARSSSISARRDETVEVARPSGFRASARCPDSVGLCLVATMGALLWLGWFPDLRRPGLTDARVGRGCVGGSLAGQAGRPHGHQRAPAHPRPRDGFRS